jgi:hypothetical protein
LCRPLCPPESLASTRSLVGLFSLTAFDRAPQVLTSKSRPPREAYDPRHQIWIVETRRQLLALAK